MAVVRNLMVRAGADFSAMRQEMKKAQESMANFKRNINRTMQGIGAALASIGIAISIRGATREAMAFEASLQQIERTMGNNASAFKRWANENASAFGLGRAEAVKYGAVYSNLIDGFAKGTAQTAQYTQDLLQASAVIASRTGRTMEDVMERIRSGLLGNTEAIEDLGVNVNIAMIESTEAFKRFANGKSWQQLDYQTQQTIRYFAILEQAANKYGTEVADNTASRQAKFIAQLKNAQLALGQAFLPIYNVILPALTRFAAGLANAMNAVAQFMQALFGSKQTQQVKATENQASAVAGLGDAYQEAGKKAKGAVAGFDEINQLADASGGAESVPAGGLGIAPEAAAEGGIIGDTMTSVSEKAQEMGEKVKAAFKEMSQFVKENSDIIIASLTGVATALAAVFVINNWRKGADLLLTAIKGIGVAMGALFSPIGLVAIAIAALVTAFVYFYRTNEQFRGLVNGILQKIGEIAVWLWQNVLVPLGQWLGTAFVAAWNAVQIAAQWLWQNALVPLGNFLLWLWQNAIIPLARILADVLGVAFRVVADIARSFWQNVLVPLGKALSEMFKPTVEAVSAVLSFLWNGVFVPLAQFLGAVFQPIISGLITVLTFLWQNVLKPVAEFVGGVFKSVFDNVFRSLGTIIDGLKTAFIGLMNFITGVFTGDWKKAWEGVKNIFKGIFESLWGIVKFPLNQIIDGINRVIEGLNSIKIDIPSWVPLFGGKSFSINIPKIPKLARGGIIDSPTIAMLGERGKEAVVPLENTSFVDAIASAVGTAVLSAMQIANSNQMSGTTDNREIVLQIDSTKLARILLPKLDSEFQRIGSSLIIKTT